MTRPLTAGQKAEDTALRHLKRAGYQLLDRNWSAKGGELDLVMLHRSTVVFVEVRLRSSAMAGSALESIGPMKQKRLVHAAQAWLMANPKYQQRACRFDTAELTHENGPVTVTVNALTL